MPQWKFCRECGVLILASSKFCEKCGTRLTETLVVPEPDVSVTQAPSKARRVIVKRVAAAFLVIILLASALVFIYRESGRPVLQFDGQTEEGLSSDAIDIKTSWKMWINEAGQIQHEESTAGRVSLDIYGGGSFTLERVEIRINETILDIAYVAIASGPHPPAGRIDTRYSETTVVMPVTVDLDLPAYVVIHVESKTEIRGDHLKVHIVGTWISLGFRERIDLNAETELWWFPKVIAMIRGGGCASFAVLPSLFVRGTHFTSMNIRKVNH